AYAPRAGAVGLLGGGTPAEADQGPLQPDGAADAHRPRGGLALVVAGGREAHQAEPLRLHCEFLLQGGLPLLAADADLERVVAGGLFEANVHRRERRERRAPERAEPLGVVGRLAEDRLALRAAHLPPPLLA